MPLLTLLITCKGPFGLADIFAMHLQQSGVRTTYVGGTAAAVQDEAVQQHLMGQASPDRFERAVLAMAAHQPSIEVTCTDRRGTLFVTVTASSVHQRRLQAA